MTNNIVPVSKAQQALAQAKTPAQSKAVEAMASAAKAYAKEQNDYEMLVNSMHLWIMARRKTTELIRPDIQRGGNGSNQHGSKGLIDATLADYGFTKQQWFRRCKELEITDDEITAYFDDCIAKAWEPTLFGLHLWKDGPHVSHNSGENEWYTPAEYIVSAVEVMGAIDLDPASSDKANETVQAKKYYTKKNSGLDKEWRGKVWMNPPYAGELIGLFVTKYAESVVSGNVPEGIVLVNNATETGWFGELVAVSSAVVFVSKRIKFIDMQGAATGSPLQGQAIVYSGNNPAKFLKEFSKFGWGAKLA